MKAGLVSTLSTTVAALAAALAATPVAAHNHDAVAQAVAGEHRTAAYTARDAARHPVETLQFLGFDQNLVIVEVSPGGGWYTEILAPAVRDHGKLIAAHFPEDATSGYMQRVRGEFLAKLEAAPEIYDQVEVIGYKAGSENALGAPGTADLVLTFRNIHGMIRGGTLDAFLGDARAVLKSGGHLGIVQHRAAAGADPDAAGESGYVPQDWLIEKVEAAGFELEATSEVNANPKDTADHPGGVWALPPSLRHGDENRDKYTAIGESDRMTLRFVKP
ncbi:MAG: methyltransferase [Gammaproteobacteria bacterium]|jgi:predicted methyltransferase